jgi:hypothetical protein
MDLRWSLLSITLDKQSSVSSLERDVLPPCTLDARLLLERASCVFERPYDEDKKLLLNSGRKAGIDAEMIATLTSICDRRRI